MLLVIIMLLSAILVLHVTQYNQTKELLELLGESAEKRVLTPDEPEMNTLSKTREEFAQYDAEQAKYPPSDLTDYEMARLERENEFDARIARIKDELASELPYYERRGYDAPILMDGIENLPHEIIRDTEKEPPDVEITI